MRTTFRREGRRPVRTTFLAQALAAIAAFTGAQAITEFPVPVSSSSPRGLTAGPGQTVWYGTHSTQKIGRIDLTLLASCQANANACMTEYPIPGATNATDPYNLVKGSDGAIWFTEGAGNKIGRLDPGKLTGCSTIPTNCITGYASSPGMFPFNIALGPDGNVWFSDSAGIARVDLTKLVGCETTPATCITHYPITGNNPVPGQDGNVWCLLYSPSGIGRIDLSKLTGCQSDATKCLTSFPLPTNSHPDNAAAGPDGNIWFTDGPNVGRIDLSALGSCSSGSCITEFPVSTQPNTFLVNLTSGPDGGLWFLNSSTNMVERMSTSGQVTNQYSIPTLQSGPQRIRTGPDGNLWFTEGIGKIGRLNPSGGGGGNPTPTPTPTLAVSPTRTPTGTSSGPARGRVTPVRPPTPKSNIEGRS